MAAPTAQAFRQRHRSVHERAAMVHDRAAELHERASRFWNARGRAEREAAERLLAVLNSARAKEQRAVAARWPCQPQPGTQHSRRNTASAESG